MIKIKTIYSFSEIGHKDNQEDRLYPSPSDVRPGQRFFILCDGMGGHDNGEVASETVSASLGQYFEAHPIDNADEAYFNGALEFAYAQLDARDTGSERKMGTTLTCVYFNEDGFLAAHIGDSRIYQIRNGEIIFKTSDHSLVNDLLKAGEITEEEAANYPRKNVITRAMQPNTRRCRADIHVSTDIQAGDYFFLCCDGVLERMSDDRLCSILGSNDPDARKFASIKAECDKGTKDNYTCWLIPMADDKSNTVKPGGDSHRSKKATAVFVISVLVALAVGALAGSLLTKKCASDEAALQKIDSLKTCIDSLNLENESLSKQCDSLRKEGADLAVGPDSINISI